MAASGSAEVHLRDGGIMKLRAKIGVAALTGSMVAAPLAIGFAGPASASNPDNLSQFCSAFTDLGLSSQGQCVSTLNTSKNGTPAGACKYLQAFFPLTYEQYFGNTGSCVSYTAGS
jgi:hypothetical protein